MRTELSLPNYENYPDHGEHEQTFLITIKKTPNGPAPWCIRRAWRGVELVAIRSASSIPEFPDFKPVSTSVNRDSFVVLRDLGLKGLERFGRKRALEWFERNWPEELGFSFAADEVNYQEF